MKFGKNIGAQQDENGELHYVGYKVLKKKIKLVCEQLEVHDLAEALSANTAFEEELSSEIRQVNECFERLHGELLCRVNDLSEQLHQVTPSEAFSGSTGSMVLVPVGSDTRTVGKEEFAPHFMKQLIILLGEVARLRRYAVWNAAAVVKILKKRRKQTNFGLEDDGAERVGWLSRHSFFSGSDFAELHVALESLGNAILVSQIRGSGVAEGSVSLKTEQQAVGRCPICLDPLVDTVELECKHRFCWKCFVLGPIASQPGQYRISTCPVCRRQTSLESSGTGQEERMEDGAMHGSHSALSRFLRTYFRDEWDQLDRDRTEELPPFGEDGEGLDLKHVVGDLMKVVQADNSWPQQRKARGLGASDLLAIENGGAGAAAALSIAECPTTLERSPAGDVAAAAAGTSAAASSDGSRQVPRDFLHTLPAPQPKDEQMRAAQKMQWLQIASVGDPLAFCGEMNCPLCSEPLHTEEFLTTPCKHHFHRVCIMRLDMPSCPLCSTALPFSWFLPAGHPLAEVGFKVIEAQRYRPMCPGGPSRGSGGYPLHRPPPTHLYGRRGLLMRSYLHKIPPMGVEDDDEAVKSPRERGETPQQTPQGSPPLGSMLAAHQEELESGGSADLSSGSMSGSSSEDSGSEDEDRPPVRWAYSAAGRMRLISRSSKLRTSSRSLASVVAASPLPRACTSTATGQGAACSSEPRECGDSLARSSGLSDWQRQPVVLCIGNHV